MGQSAEAVPGRSRAMKAAMLLAVAFIISIPTAASSAGGPGDEGGRDCTSPGWYMSGTIIVAQNGGGNFTTLQEALGAAMPGSVIRVWEGTYNGTFWVNRPLSIIGNGTKETIILGYEYSDVLHISGDWVNVSQLSVTGGGYYYDSSGIRLSGADNCDINNTHCTGSYNGIYLSNSHENVIHQNTAEDNSGPGILLHTSAGNRLVENTCRFSGQGITLETGANGNEVSDNHVYRNTMAGLTISYSHNNVVRRNIINDTGGWGWEGEGAGCGNQQTYGGVFLSRSDSNLLVANRVVSNDMNGLWLADSRDNILKNNYVSQSSTAIYLDDAPGSVLCGNEMFNCGILFGGGALNHWTTQDIDETNLVNDKPVRYVKDLTGGTVPAGAGQVILANCTGVKVKGQSISAATAGIQLGYSKDNVIRDNEIFQNQLYSMLIRYSDNNTMRDNDCSDNSQGIFIAYSRENMVVGNMMLNNSEAMNIYFSHNNTVRENVWRGDRYGGLSMIGSSHNLVENNTGMECGGNGITIYQWSEGNTVRHNRLMYSYGGLHSYGGAYNRYVNNRFEGNERYGMYLGSPYRADVENNTFYYNGVPDDELCDTGLSMYHPRETRIHNNLVSGNELGINLEWAESCDITANYLAGNTVIGLRLPDWGGNRIFHNSFANNAVNAEQPAFGSIHTVVSNNWNDSHQEGNYWSDYAGADNGADGRFAGDGIGDTDLPHLGLDDYPFISPQEWTTLEVPEVEGPALDMDGQFLLQWVPVPRATWYFVQEASDENFTSGLRSFHCEEPEANVTVPKEGTYYYRAQAHNDYCGSNWSVTRAVEVDLPPETPQNVTVTPCPRGNALCISWDPVPGNTKLYRVWGFCASTGKWGIIAKVDHPELHHNQSGLRDGMSYYYEVQAEDMRGRLSDRSEAVYGMPLDTLPPTPPDNVTATGSGRANMRVTWQESPEADTECYNIYRREYLESKYTLVGHKMVGDMYMDRGLEPGTPYYYVVTALDRVPNESEFSAEAAGVTWTVDPPPDDPDDDVPPLKMVGLVMTEDTPDRSSVTLQTLFDCDVGDYLTYFWSGSGKVSVKLFKYTTTLDGARYLAGTVILTPEEDFCGKDMVTMYAERDGVAVRALINVTVLPVNDAPRDARILTPADGRVIMTGDALNLTAACFDPDGPYGDELTYSWSTNLTGYIGSGTTIAYYHLKQGEHLITLTVTDSQGAATSTAVKVSVVDAVHSGDDAKAKQAGGELLEPAMLALIVIFAVLAGVLTVLYRRGGGEYEVGMVAGDEQEDEEGGEVAPREVCQAELMESVDWEEGPTPKPGVRHDVKAELVTVRLAGEELPRSNAGVRALRKVKAMARVEKEGKLVEPKKGWFGA